ncbi:hypothetical protein [Algoriphagus antarcticus]|nr:hypothetical protein [Algoriphagus antarcticus]
MASITNAVLNIAHDHQKKMARVKVTCKINFTSLELCQMKTCKGNWFKLKCQLWGEDSGLTGADDFLYTFGNVFFFPDATPSASETKTFEVEVGEGLLNEDFGTDEIYAKLILYNLTSMVTVRKKSNVVSHSF